MHFHASNNKKYMCNIYYYKTKLDCVSNGCSMHACGAIGVGKDMLETLRSIAKETGNMTDDDAKKYLEGMHKEGILGQELWA